MLNNFFSRFWINASQMHPFGFAGWHLFFLMFPVFRMRYGKKGGIEFCLFAGNDELEEGYWAVDEQSEILVPCVGSDDALQAWCCVLGIPWNRGIDRAEDMTDYNALLRSEEKWKIFYYRRKSLLMICCGLIRSVFVQPVGGSFFLLDSVGFRVLLVLISCLGVVYMASNSGVFQ